MVFQVCSEIISASPLVLEVVGESVVEAGGEVVGEAVVGAGGEVVGEAAVVGGEVVGGRILPPQYA